jgi:hypothetical protein
MIPFICATVGFTSGFLTESHKTSIRLKAETSNVYYRSMREAYLARRYFLNRSILEGFYGGFKLGGRWAAWTGGFYAGMEAMAFAIEEGMGWRHSYAFIKAEEHEGTKGPAIRPFTGGVMGLVLALVAKRLCESSEE